MIDEKLKAKGRALSAARVGLSTAIEDLSSAGRVEEAEEAKAALKRSYRMEAARVADQQSAVA